MPKFESRYFKYKIYKKLKSDIGGEVLLKYKRDKLTSFILRHFEYKLNQFKTNFKKWISIFHPQEKDYFEMRQPFLNVMNRKNEYKPFREGLTFKKKNDGLIVLFKHAHSVRRKLMKIWRLRQRQRFVIGDHLTDQIFSAPPVKNKLPTIQLKPKRGQDVAEEISEERMKELQYARIKSNVRRDLKRTKPGSNMRNLSLDRTNEKFIRLNWLNIQLTERRYAHFYGFKSLSRFKLLQDSAFYCNKLRLNGVFKLEGMLSVFAFRLNLAPNVYQCRLIVQSGILAVNGRRILNPTFRLNVFDVISMDTGKEEFKFMSRIMWKRLRQRKFFVNVPDYIQIKYNPNIAAIIWRYPLRSEIVGPYSFPFTKNPHDWSFSSKTTRR